MLANLRSTLDVAMFSSCMALTTVLFAATLLTVARARMATKLSDEHTLVKVTKLQSIRMVSVACTVLVFVALIGFAAGSTIVVNIVWAIWTPLVHYTLIRLTLDVVALYNGSILHKVAIQTSEEHTKAMYGLLIVGVIFEWVGQLMYLVAHMRWETRILYTIWYLCIGFLLLLLVPLVLKLRAKIRNMHLQTLPSIANYNQVQAYKKAVKKLTLLAVWLILWLIPNIVGAAFSIILVGSFAQDKNNPQLWVDNFHWEFIPGQYWTLFAMSPITFLSFTWVPAHYLTRGNNAGSPLYRGDGRYVPLTDADANNPSRRTTVPTFRLAPGM